MSTKWTQADVDAFNAKKSGNSVRIPVAGSKSSKSSESSESSKIDDSQLFDVACKIGRQWLQKGLIIGIDPDVDKNGIAVWDRELKTIELSSLTFFQLFNYLQFAAKGIELVKIEAGWKHRKQNYHGAKNAAIGAKIGSHVGANAESGRKIIEMCEYLGIPHKEVKPLRKIWKNGKISHAELQQLLKLKGIPEIIGRTNQEMRDAALICLNG